jgi:hypothetical protein
LSESQASVKSDQLLDEVLSFIDNSTGLKSNVSDGGKVSIRQAADGKTFSFDYKIINGVLQRTDADGKKFIQINFHSGVKVLLTDTLVGFKPSEVTGLDMTKIPRVVTTPDLLSVFEAIEESLGSDSIPEQEIEILRRVFQAILQGGELAGFDLAPERSWIARLAPSRLKASA